MSEADYLPCTFAGFQINVFEDGGFTVDQNHYLRHLEELPTCASLSDFRSMRMKLAWISNSRPDFLFEISQLAQVTESMFLEKPKEQLKHLNRVVRYAVSHPLEIRFPHLDPNTHRLVGFSDASFADNHDVTFQLGCIVLLMDDNGNATYLSLKSFKARRVARNIFDSSLTLPSELQGLLSRKIPLHLLIDSECLFDVISKGSRTSEKRIMSDIAATRERYRRHDITNIGFVQSSRNIADGLTKVMNQAAPFDLVKSSTLIVAPEQWIIRH